MFWQKYNHNAHKTSFANSTGGFFWTSEDDTPIPSPLANWTVALPTIRLPFYKTVLLRTDRSLPESQEDVPSLVPARATPMEGILLLRCHEKSQLRQDARQSHLRPDPVGSQRRGLGQMGKCNVYFGFKLHQRPMTFSYLIFIEIF